MASDKVTITVLKKSELYIPTIFSPNGDGINDVLPAYVPSDTKLLKSLRFYSRWGELVSENKNFAPISPVIGWDGTSHGEPLNPGVYVWLAEVEFEDGRVRKYEGNVTLIK